jgi:general secretion pathway protein G
MAPRWYVESPLACVAGVTGSSVNKRIEDIMNNRTGVRLNVTRKAALALAAVALAASIFVGMMTMPLQAQLRKRASDPSALVRTKETVLKYALFQVRDAIDRYHMDKKQYPSSLARLVNEGYISQIPTDPFTNRPDSWKTVPSKPDPNKPAAGPGIYDVMSGSEATAMDGTKYSTW